jgi:hypothetical protein
LSRISIVGCFFSSGLSTTIFRERPVTSSTSSWIRDVGDEVLVLHRARVLGEDREGVGIPLDQDGALLDVRPVAHLEARAVDDRVALAIAPLRVLDTIDPVRFMTTSSPLASAPIRRGLGLDDLQALVADGAGVLGVERRLLADARRRAADVERAHRQLRAGLADRLRRDDADREAELDQLAGREVAAVALGAAAAPRRAGEHRADADLLDARSWIAGRRRLVELLVLLDDQLARERIDDPLERDAADDALAQRLDDLARLDDRLASMPSIVPQSISWMMTSCATSTRRRVR